MNSRECALRLAKAALDDIAKIGKLSEEHWKESILSIQLLYNNIEKWKTGGQDDGKYKQEYHVNNEKNGRKLIRNFLAGSAGPSGMYPGTAAASEEIANQESPLSSSSDGDASDAAVDRYEVVIRARDWIRDRRVADHNVQPPNLIEMSKSEGDDFANAVEFLLKGKKTWRYVKKKPISLYRKALNMSVERSNLA